MMLGNKWKVMGLLQIWFYVVGLPNFSIGYEHIVLGKLIADIGEHGGIAKRKSERGIDLSPQPQYCCVITHVRTL